jgi:hypothetical protein
LIVIHDAKRADSSGSQVKQCRRAKPAGSDYQDARSFQLRLPWATDFAQYDVAGIAFEFFCIEHHG